MRYIYRAIGVDALGVDVKPAEAHAALMGIARKGRAFVNREVHQRVPGWDEYDPNAKFGVGLIFERTIEVADLATDQSVTAVARLQVIATVGNTLFLCTTLVWKPRGGLSEHVSYARYELDDKAAWHLEVSPTIEECEARGIDCDPVVDERLVVCKAVWQQHIPTTSAVVTARDESVPWCDIDLSAEDVTRDHHTSVIAGLSDPMLCMLSDTLDGDVDRTEIETLLGWVRQQPEVATMP